MTCTPLAGTGGGPLDLMLGISIACLLAGAALLLMSRRRGRVVAVALLLLLTGSAASLTVAAPLPAVASDCPPPSTSLTIVQTSVMDGLAPGIDPVAITGTVTNNGANSTHVTTIVVEITEVAIRPDAAPGTCAPTDYVLLQTAMPVDRTLGPGETTGFSGALIGFNDTSVNQDACKGATVHLRYTAYLG